MKTFDYKTAWNHLIVPIWESFDSAIWRLYERVYLETKDLAQNADLSLSFPENSDLKKSFEALTTEDLCLCARVADCLGHWHPGKNPFPGASWKFAKYCDAILRERFDLSYGKEKLDTLGMSGNCFCSFELLEGMFRVQFAHHYFWMWKEICPATEENYQALLGLEKTSRYLTATTDCDRAQKRLDCLEAHFKALQTPEWQAFYNVAETYQIDEN